MKPALKSLISRSAPAGTARAKAKTAPRQIDLWFHATEESHVPAFLQLRRGISVERTGLRCLITSDGRVPRPDGLDPRIDWHVISSDKSADTETFFSRFDPKLCLWAGGRLMPGLIAEADRRGVALCLLDAVAESFGAPFWRGASLFERRALKAFSAFLVRDQAGAAALRRLGVDEKDVQITGRLQQGIPVLGHNEDDLADLTQAISSRPTWLAACLRAQELGIVLEAHRNASRAAHRLLLLLVPDDEEEVPLFKDALEQKGLRFSVWSDLEGLSDETSQVLLAEDPFEMGLWLRAAPLCLLGCSLAPGLGGHNPFAAANLGSAILYGPNVGKHLDAYSRFAQAGGARIVRDVETLSAAVIQLSAPDRAAKMAMAAWELATEGADVTDRVTSLVHDTLDHLEVP